MASKKNVVRHHPMHHPTELRGELGKMGGRPSVRGHRGLPIEEDLYNVLGILNGRVKAQQALTAEETKIVQSFVVRWAV